MGLKQGPARATTLLSGVNGNNLPLSHLHWPQRMPPTSHSTQPAHCSPGAGSTAQSKQRAAASGDREHSPIALRSENTDDLPFTLCGNTDTYCTTVLTCFDPSFLPEVGDFFIFFHFRCQSYNASTGYLFVNPFFSRWSAHYRPVPKRVAPPRNPALRSVFSPQKLWSKPTLVSCNQYSSGERRHIN